MISPSFASKCLHFETFLTETEQFNLNSGNPVKPSRHTVELGEAFDVLKENVTGQEEMVYSAFYLLADYHLLWLW